MQFLQNAWFMHRKLLLRMHLINMLLLTKHLLRTLHLLILSKRAWAVKICKIPASVTAFASTHARG